MARQHWRRRVGAAFFLTLFAVGGLWAQSNPTTGLTLSELQTRLKHAQSETELDPKLKQQVIETYQAAIERLEIADEATSGARSFLQRVNSIPDDMHQVQQKLVEVSQNPAISEAPDEEIDVLERKLAEHRSHIDEPEHGLRAKADAAKKELAVRKTRLEEITRDLAEIDERLSAIQEEIDAPIPENEPRELTNARHALLQTRRTRANEERTAYRAEEAWCESDDATDLLRARIELASKELTQAETSAQVLQEAIDQRRGSEADQRVHAAEQLVARTTGPVKEVAEVNLALAKESRDVAVALRETTQRLDTTRASFNTLKGEFDQSRTMVEAIGLTESIGLLLRQQRAKLSDTRGLHSRLALRGDTVRATRMRLFQLDAELTALQDLDAASEKTARELTSEDSPLLATTELSATARHLLEDIRPLLQERRDLLELLNSDYGTEFEKMVLLDNDERKLLNATEQYADYIDERVLWIRTGTAFGSSQVGRAAVGIGWITDKANWQKVVDALRVNIGREPLPYAFALAALLMWVGLRWTVRSRIQLLGVEAADQTCREMLPTLQTILLTMMFAAVVPVTLRFFGWRLDHCASTSRFVHAVSVGLSRAANFAVPLELLRATVARGGLADRHFGWQATTLVRLRRHLNWFIPLGIVLIGFVGMIEANADEQRLDALGRSGYLMFAALLSLFCYRAFPRPAQLTPVIPPAPIRNSQDARRAQDLAGDDDFWMMRAARVGAFLAVAIPLGLLVLCWSGYFYTALQLTWRLQATAWLATALVMLRGTVQRWLTLERRRMAILQAEELQAIEGAGKQPGSHGHSQFLFPRWTWPDFRLNLTQIVTQVRSLLDTGLVTLAAIGLWFVWADVTPALNILDRVTIWQTTVEEVVPMKGADDKPAVQVVKRSKAITAADLGLAILLTGIATVAARNIPGLVEVILLEHLSVDAGIRFATTCLVRYAIFTAGVVLAFNQIGIGWNSVQWLVAAASVGLGFGLQEIFANFVSGIILLFERPMRVGDVITIGDTTGTVSRIRFRATTIVDGDRKELIVPNKSFITGNLLNWTLSDSINRVAIKVGVAYGSDPNRVRELLLKIAGEHPALLKEPSPTASLEELGDSALVFQLKAFLPNLKDRQRVTHELNSMIHNRFREVGIDIPFPQHEVSLKIQNPTSRPEPVADLHGSLEAALQRAGVRL